MPNFWCRLWSNFWKQMLSYTTSPGRIISEKKSFHGAKIPSCYLWHRNIYLALYCVFVKNLEQNTVKLRTKKNWPYKTGDLLKEVQLIWNFLWQDKKKWPYKTGDLLKEVQLIWNFLWQDKKRWPYKTGDLLKEVQLIWNFLWQDKKRWL